MTHTAILTAAEDPNLAVIVSLASPASPELMPVILDAARAAGLAAFRLARLRPDVKSLSPAHVQLPSPRETPSA